MRLADYASRKATEAHDLDSLYSQGAGKAFERAEFLNDARDEEEALQIEASLQKKRDAMRSAARLKEAAAEAAMVLEATTLDAPCGGSYLTGYLGRFARGQLSEEEEVDALEIGRAASLVGDDVFASRRRLVLALQQCASFERVVTQFATALEGKQTEQRQLQRTLRLLETSAANGLRTALQPKQRELDELRCLNEQAVHETCQLRDVVSRKSRRLDVANRIAQRLKVVTQAKSECCDAFSRQLWRLARHLRQARGASRLVTADREKDAAAQTASMLVLEKRATVVATELARLKGHTAEYTNCDVWNPGIMQRIKTKALKEALRGERTKSNAALKTMRLELKKVETARREAAAFQRRKDADARVVDAVCAAVDSSRGEAAKRTVAEELAALEKEQRLALELVLRRCLCVCVKTQWESVLESQRIQDSFEREGSFRISDILETFPRYRSRSATWSSRSRRKRRGHRPATVSQRASGVRFYARVLLERHGLETGVSVGTTLSRVYDVESVLESLRGGTRTCSGTAFELSIVYIYIQIGDWSGNSLETLSRYVVKKATTRETYLETGTHCREGHRRACASRRPRSGAWTRSGGWLWTCSRIRWRTRT